MEISPSHTQVYLIDFQAAIQYPLECPPNERATTGYLLGGSYTDPEMYSCPHPPESPSGEPFSPFKTPGNWAPKLLFIPLLYYFLSRHLKLLQSTIDEILVDMVKATAVYRLREALDEIRKVPDVGFDALKNPISGLFGCWTLRFLHTALL